MIITIVSISYQGTVCVIEGVDENGKTHFVYAESNPFLNAIMQAFGNLRNAIGQTINASISSYGTMLGFSPEVL